MRTTLDIDASVLRELRRRGKREEKTMGQVASELLAAAIARPAPPRDPAALRWRTADLGTPSVDLEDKEALQRLLDETA